jgi:hypothetical protein
MSMRYKGGVISATPPTTSTTSASGSWTLQQQMQATAAGNWPKNGPFNYIEDVFSTWLYTGNGTGSAPSGTAQTITNGVDLAGKGGLVWIKNRSSTRPHGLYDTSRGAYQYLTTSGGGSPGTGAQLNFNPGGVSAFNSNGFTVFDDSSSTYAVNGSGLTYASWTFREQPKFFDVVTYTGTGGTRTVAHNLGSVPGCIIVKQLDAAENWFVYHRSLGATKVMTLNTTAAQDTSNLFWNDTEPTSTNFTVRYPNASGGTYVAYVFAHDAGGFGLTGTDNVISCGSYTTNSVAQATVTLGYEPQWLMVKPSSGTGDWCIFDNMRGWPGTPFTGSNYSQQLVANTSGAESQTAFQVTSTGFVDPGALIASGTVIYIAIRRGPMKVPTTGTSVFDPEAVNAATGTQVTTGFPVDMQMGRTGRRSGNEFEMIQDRLRGISTTSTASGEQLFTGSTDAESSGTRSRNWNNTGFEIPANLANINAIFWNFRRAPGFFDEVCYTGDGTSNRAITHNLTVSPGIVIIRKRNNIMNWAGGYNMNSNGSSYARLVLNNNSPDGGYASAIISAVSSTTFSVGVSTQVNASGDTYAAYLFASCPGVSRIGSFTGTGATQAIDCGFTSGARFVLIKSTSDTGDWYVWDSARGIVAGNDPYITLNTTNPEVTNTDWVDTAATGFELSNAGGNLANSSGVSYIFLAVS